MKFSSKSLFIGGLVLASMNVMAADQNTQTITAQPVSLTPVISIGTLEGIVNLRENIRQRGIDRSDKVLLAKPEKKVNVSEQKVAKIADTETEQDGSDE